MTDSVQREKEITKVTLVGSVVNLVLTVFKILAGILGASAAMVADGIHSLSDLISDFVVIVFVRISSKGSDKEHDFGHGKFETFAAFIVSLMLFAVGIELMVSGIRSIVEIASGGVPAHPSIIALIAAIVSIVLKEILYRYTHAAAKKMDSPVVEANAWHHRSDALSSIGSFFGIGGAMLLGDKWSLLDPLAACIISIMILWVAIKMAMPAIGDLMDRSLPDNEEEMIMKAAKGIDGVKGLHELKTHRLGKDILIEAHLVVDPDINVRAAHNIATNVERAFREKFGHGTQISLHIEPDDNSE